MSPMFLFFLFLLALVQVSPSTFTIVFDNEYIYGACEKNNHTVLFSSMENETFIFLKFKKDKDSAVPEMNCTLELRTDPGYGIFISISEVKFPSNKNKTNNHLILEDGNSNITVDGDRSCQDTNCDWGKFNSTSSILLTVATDQNTTTNLFSGGATVFHPADSTGKCPFHDSFRCKNNWCIWKELTCNGFNNCGDRSDEDFELCHPHTIKDTVVGVLVIILGILVLVTFLPMMLYLAIQGAKSTVRAGPILPFSSMEDSPDRETESLDQQPKTSTTEHHPTSDYPSLNLLDNEVQPAIEHSPDKEKPNAI